jgi:hypothetical protein
VDPVPDPLLFFPENLSDHVHIYIYLHMFAVIKLRDQISRGPGSIPGATRFSEK